MIRVYQVCLILLLTMVVGCSSTGETTIKVEVSPENQVQANWIFQGTEENYTPSAGVVEEGILYIGDSNKNFYALEQDTGNVVWMYESHTINPFRPVIAGEIVLFSNYGGRLYALNKRNGERIWDFQTETGMSNQATVIQDSVFIGDTSETIYELDLKSGEVLSNQPGYIKDEGIQVVDGLFYLYDNFDNLIYSMEPETGERVWEFQLEEDLTPSKPIIHNGKIYVTAGDIFEKVGSLFVLELETGEELWRSDYDGVIYSSPVVTDESITFAVGEKVVTLSHERDVLWEVALDDEAYTFAGSPLDGVIFVGTEGKVTEFLLKDGEVQSTYLFDVPYIERFTLSRKTLTLSGKGKVATFYSELLGQQDRDYYEGFEDVELMLEERKPEEEEAEQEEPVSQVPAKQFEAGEYVSYLGTLVISNVTDGELDFDIYVSSNLHTGELAGRAQINNHKAVFFDDEHAEFMSGEACELTLTLMEGYIEVSQNFGCTAYHGVAVSFEGSFYKEESQAVEEEEPVVSTNSGAKSSDDSFLTAAANGAMTGCEYSLNAGVTGEDIIDEKGVPEWEGYFDGGYGIKYGSCIYYVASYLDEVISTIDMAGASLDLTPTQARDRFGLPISEGVSDIDGSYIMIYESNGFRVYLYFADSETKLEMVRLQ
ncbi:PQQ-binding-like beta-propeller repeat protein [Alkalihalobacillus sp. MEB130]|uniref:PQQ-binding-like beta-propeller repeat protein n=1 Tax=Alkalihalobacillus sp. MEB130 TaxID=2976704 RepID=UPI0028DE29BC|nr:PQQ-binding-like beta-propeller repeat protein [Alkalihalobacillus sp. MEB130]MDT8858919.1 PQQ-binding-like beta-propeller repeat protein [Alkalihalobacillus sp. MEB130]